MRSWLVCAAALVAAAASAAAQRPAAPIGLEPLLARLSARVEQFYARARTVTSRESVRFQQLESDFRPVGFARRLVYELRLAWDPDGDGFSPIEGKALRQLMSVNGRPPRPKDEPECTDPEDVSTDALSMLLAQKRDLYEFAAAVSVRLDNRAALAIDFRNVSKEPPEITWTEECVRVTIPGRTKGRIWIDAETLDVLRLDEHLTGMFDFPTSEKIARRNGVYRMALERYDSSIRYHEVTFDDPQETLTLPRRVETIALWSGLGPRRYLITQEYSDYRRFVTGGRVVPTDTVR